MKEIIEMLSIYCDNMDELSISEETSLMDDLELSSMDVFSLFSEIETKYDIQITEREIQRIATVGDLMHIVEDKTKRASRPR